MMKEYHSAITEDWRHISIFRAGEDAYLSRLPVVDWYWIYDRIERVDGALVNMDRCQSIQSKCYVRGHGHGSWSPKNLKFQDELAPSELKELVVGPYPDCDVVLEAEHLYKEVNGDPISIQILQREL